MTDPARPPRVLRPEADVAALLDILAGSPALHSMTPEVARAGFVAAAPLFYPEMPLIDQRRCTIGGVPVRIYRPLGHADSAPMPALLYFHGGGWVMGDLDGFAPICATLAKDAKMCVVLVDYLLAPEHPFPAALEQAIRVSEAVFTDAEALGVDRTRLAIGGDSAGGNLAAVVAIDRRNKGQTNFELQLLIYPVTDARLTGESYADCGERFMLTREDMAWFCSHYLSEGMSADDWRVSPLLAPSHSGLPPAHIITCGLDPLQDDGRRYADALERAGVDVSRRHFAGQIHGFLFMGKSLARVRPALAEIASILRAALGPKHQADE
jgi:acetyl esterase